MNKKAKTTIYLGAFVITILLVSLAFAVRPQCKDKIDNDGDSLIDYPADPGFTGPNDNSEFNPATTTTIITTTVGNFTG